MKNIFWPVYLGLEKELLDLADVIHIDDEQLEVYSIKIGNLLVRTVVEIESLSKALFFQNGGEEPEDRDLYFDTDCLQLLEDRWTLSKKQVVVSNPNFYLEEVGNLILTPLYKANKRGTSGADWKKAYQAIKHNRADNLKKGCLKSFVRALAALYLLNIYYKDERFAVDKNHKSDSIDYACGSRVFSVLCHTYNKFCTDGHYTKADNFDACAYLTIPEEKSLENYTKAAKLVEEKTNAICRERVNAQLRSIDPANAMQFIRNKYDEFLRGAIDEAAKLYGPNVMKAVKDMVFDVTLNKNQV